MHPNIEKYKDTYQNLPQILQIKKLWHHDYWDGALSGVCEVNGEKCWFECIEQWLDNNEYPEGDDAFEPPWYRRFLIWKLTPEQFKNIEEAHLKFRRMVGAHTDYDENGKRLDRFIDGGITQESVNQYYEDAKSGKNMFPDYYPISDEYVLGWYEW